MAQSATADQEHAVGITAFVSSSTPVFECTIKQRYTDFLVNEILPGGVVQHLLDDEAPDKGKQDHFGTSHAHENGTAQDSGEAVKGSGKRKQLESGEEAVEEDLTAAKRQKLDGGPTGHQQQHVSETGESRAKRKEQILLSITESDHAKLRGLLGEDITNAVFNLYASVMMYPDKKPRDQPKVQSEIIPEKAKRTEIHKALREIFGSKLSTETLQDSPGAIDIRAAPTKGPSGARGGGNAGQNGGSLRGKAGWDELGGEYLHFTLYKENKDVMEVLRFLASQLKVPAKDFQFAGTKDRRGVTVQRVAIKRIRAERMVQLNNIARGWRLGDFEYHKNGLVLAELDGNEFHLTLRNCHLAGDENLSHHERLGLVGNAFEKAATSYQEKGFLNYFGLQRFGSYNVGSHDTGRKMLQGDLQGAVNLILTYSDNLLSDRMAEQDMSRMPQDDIDRADAIHGWINSGFQSKDAIDRLPRRFHAEIAIIRHLSKTVKKQLVNSSDWQGALAQVQRNLMTMYLHAYQSFVWNHAASRRMERYGQDVVEGDLVIVGDRNGPPPRDQVDASGEPIFHPAENDSAPSVDNAFTRARHLSKEEAESGKYSIFDIVLPQPGFDVLYPANEIGKFYEEFMASELGGGLDPHNMKRSWKDISLPGAYRKMMAKPGDGFEFELKTYTNSDQQFVETDWERLKASRSNDRSYNGHSCGEIVNGSDEEKKIAVVLKTKLGGSQYATMALRELTKGGAVNYKPEFSATR